MPISMQLDARYVTQASFYNNAGVLGPLTDRRIKRYELAGYYGKDVQLARKHERELKQEKQHASRRLQKLLEVWR